MERSNAPAPAPIPVQAVPTASASQIAFEKSSVVIRILPLGAKRITPALSPSAFSSTAVPLFERYCAFLI
jgi:hypothetical protein